MLPKFCPTCSKPLPSTAVPDMKCVICTLYGSPMDRRTKPVVTPNVRRKVYSTRGD
jgi:hypothetical protein